jgi:hypothetical protein
LLEVKTERPAGRRTCSQSYVENHIDAEGSVEWAPRGSSRWTSIKCANV